jgi:hypothetical protein
MAIRPPLNVPKDLREWSKFFSEAYVTAEATPSIADADIPATIARDSEVTSAISSAIAVHAAAADPHPTYTTAAEVSSAIAAASITESQVTDGSILARVGSTETITGAWSYSLPPRLPSYTVATLPSAVTYARGLIYVSDEAGGATVAFSDGAAWRRLQDLAVVS